jgi:hypothetical protein
MNLRSEVNNWLEISYYDSVDEKWKKFHISMDEVCKENEDLWKMELDIALQDIIYEKEKLNIRGTIQDALR